MSPRVVLNLCFIKYLCASFLPFSSKSVCFKTALGNLKMLHQACFRGRAAGRWDAILYDNSRAESLRILQMRQLVKYIIRSFVVIIPWHFCPDEMVQLIYESAVCHSDRWLQLQPRDQTQARNACIDRKKKMSVNLFVRCTIPNLCLLECVLIHFYCH